LISNKSLLLHLVGLAFIYYSKTHGHSNIEYLLLCTMCMLILLIDMYVI